jgi:cytoskeletal protein CcmA (bactofilin family)
MLRQHDWLVALIALGLGVAGAARAGDDALSTVMGSITVAAGEHRGDLSTVNGSIHLAEGAVVGHAHTVNGSISLDPHATAAELATVNGSVRLGDGAQVSGRVHTVNGSMSLNQGADVTGALTNVNGSIRVAAAHVGGDVGTVTGDVEIGPDARVDGGVVVRKDNSSDMGSRGTPRVVIGPGSVVKGTLRFEREVRLYVSDRATIGPVEGATAIRFTGERPPE